MELEVDNLKYAKVGEVVDTPIGSVGVVEDSFCQTCAFFHSPICALYECVSWNRPDSKSVHFELIDDKNWDKWN